MSELNSLQNALNNLPDIHLLDKPEPIAPACESCNGTGYISFNVPVGNPYFGKLHTCDNPDCPVVAGRRREQVSIVMQRSTWDIDYGNLTFESFWYLIDPIPDGWTGKRGAYSATNMFAINNGRPFTLPEAARRAFDMVWPGKVDTRESIGVVLTGEVGLGKTGLAVAAANLLMAMNMPVVFIRVRDLIARIQETYKQNYDGESADQRLKFYSSVRFLILDEFALENYTDDRLEIVETIIRSRDRSNLPTMITTNLTLKDVYANWQPRIADIVAKSHWVQIGGVKLRQTREKAQTW